MNQNINAVDVLNKLPWGLKGNMYTINKQFIIEILKLFSIQFLLIDWNKYFKHITKKIINPNIPVSDNNSI